MIPEKDPALFEVTIIAYAVGPQLQSLTVSGSTSLIMMLPLNWSSLMNGTLGQHHKTDVMLYQACKCCHAHPKRNVVPNVVIGPATHFGLMGDGWYDDMWAGWCTKVICDHFG